MGRRIIDFGVNITTKKEIYSDDNKKIFNINDININEILISQRLFPLLNLNQFVIVYKHNHNIKPLYIKLLEYVSSGYTFKKNITISSKIDDADLFEKYNKIWKKIEELMRINFEKKTPFCNNIAYTTKIKTLSSYSEDYQDTKIPKKEIIYKFSSIAILHSVNTKDNKYYRQAYMHECKYERIEQVSYFDNDSDSDNDSDFNE